MKLCRIFASRFCKCQRWNAEFLHYLFVVDFLMNLAEKWLCRIFASRFCKCQSWNAKFLHYQFVVDSLMNLAGKWLCRIFASRFCKCQRWNAEFLHYPFVVDFLMNLAGKWLCRIFASRFCKSQSWNAEFLHYLFVVWFFNEISGKMALQNFCIQILQVSKLKCRISALSICSWFCNEFSGNMATQNFASRFLSWNAEFLHDPFFVDDFVMNLAGKWLCRIFASSLQVKMQNFCIIHICYNYFLSFFSSVISQLTATSLYLLGITLASCNRAVIILTFWQKCLFCRGKLGFLQTEFWRLEKHILVWNTFYGLGRRGGEGGQQLIDYPQFGLVFQLSFFFKSLKSLFQKQSFECI